MLTWVIESQAVTRCRNQKSLSYFMPFALFLALFWLQPAHAQSNRMGLTCVGNKSGSRINFSFQFGDGQWRPTSVNPQHWRPISFGYDFINQNSGPVLRVRFDADTSSGTYYVTQELKQYASPTSNCNANGRKYNFHQRGNRIYLESAQ